MERMSLGSKAKVTEVSFCKNNPSFYTGVVRILASDVIANRTSFTSEAIEKAIPSLSNIPLVALYKEEEQTVGGHEVEYNIDEKEGLVISYGTHPIGVIPESAKVWYEEVMESGVMRKYLCAEVLLWKREKIYRLFKKKRSFNVSMEIQVVSREQKATHDEITEFYFTAIAVLGKESPAFKSANLKIFSQESDFQQMLDELKDYMEYSKKERGEVMAEETKPTEKENEELNEATEETTKAEETVETEEYAETKDEEVAETKEDSEDESDETSTDESNEVLNEESNEDSTDELNEDSKKETQDEEVEEEETEDFELLYSELQAQHEQLTQNLAEKEQAYLALQNEYETLKVSHEALVVFKTTVEQEKRQVAEEELFNRFVELSHDEGYKTLKANAKEFSLQDLETQLYAMAGKRLFSAQLPQEKHSVVIDSIRQPEVNSVFSILDKYL